MTQNTNKNNETDILQRLAQASVEGLVVKVAINSIIPGAGIAVGGLNQAKNIKRAAKVIGKETAVKGVQLLDDEQKEKTPLEDLGEDASLEILSRIGGRE